MPKTLTIHYPKNYLFMTQAQLNGYIAQQVAVLKRRQAISVGDKINLGRPLYYQGQKIIRQTCYPDLNFRRVVTIIS